MALAGGDPAKSAKKKRPLSRPLQLIKKAQSNCMIRQQKISLATKTELNRQVQRIKVNFEKVLATYASENRQ